MAPKTLYLNNLFFMRIRKAISIFIIVAFMGTSIRTPVFAQPTNPSDWRGLAEGGMASDPMPFMAKPGVMVHLSPEFAPAYLKGIVIHPENALKFDFIIYKGDRVLTEAQKKQEYTKLTKYFLASLAIPDDDQWVNLSPYEKDRIIKDDFGKTEMGRDLLAQDYMLKQITASLIYPEDNLGKKFWDRVYTQAQKQFGTTNIPVNTFNKVWILPDDAFIYEKGNTAYVLRNHLKVMLEEDYLSLKKHAGISSVPVSTKNNINALGSKIVRQIVLPELEREVNEDKNFATVRQVYSGMLLAAWYKRALKESLLSKIYANKAKVKGVDQDPRTNEQIYLQYLKAYKKGVFNFIKEDVDRYTNEVIPRKYFSGGTGDYAMASVQFGHNVIRTTSDPAELARAQEELESNEYDLAQVAAVENPREEEMRHLLLSGPITAGMMALPQLSGIQQADRELILEAITDLKTTTGYSLQMALLAKDLRGISASLNKAIASALQYRLIDDNAVKFTDNLPMNGLDDLKVKVGSNASRIDMVSFQKVMDQFIVDLQAALDSAMATKKGKAWGIAHDLVRYFNQSPIVVNQYATKERVTDLLASLTPDEIDQVKAYAEQIIQSLGESYLPEVDLLAVIAEFQRNKLKAIADDLVSYFSRNPKVVSQFDKEKRVTVLLASLSPEEINQVRIYAEQIIQKWGKSYSSDMNLSGVIGNFQENDAAMSARPYLAGIQARDKDKIFQAVRNLGAMKDDDPAVQLEVLDKYISQTSPEVNRSIANDLKNRFSENRAGKGQAVRFLDEFATVPNMLVLKIKLNQGVVNRALFQEVLNQFLLDFIVDQLKYFGMSGKEWTAIYTQYIFMRGNDIDRVLTAAGVDKQRDVVISTLVKEAVNIITKRAKNNVEEDLRQSTLIARSLDGAMIASQQEALNMMHGKPVLSFEKSPTLAYQLPVHIDSLEQIPTILRKIGGIDEAKYSLDKLNANFANSVIAVQFTDGKLDVYPMKTKDYNNAALEKRLPIDILAKNNNTLLTEAQSNEGLNQLLVSGELFVIWKKGVVEMVSTDSMGVDRNSAFEVVQPESWGPGTQKKTMGRPSYMVIQNGATYMVNAELTAKGKFLPSNYMPADEQTADVINKADAAMHVKKVKASWGRENEGLPSAVQVRTSVNVPGALVMYGIVYNGKVKTILTKNGNKVGSMLLGRGEDIKFGRSNGVYSFISKGQLFQRIGEDFKYIGPVVNDGSFKVTRIFRNDDGVLSVQTTPGATRTIVDDGVHDPVILNKNDTYRTAIKFDAAMNTLKNTNDHLGGIDFNAANLNLQIKRDGRGVPLPISQQDLENIHIDGLIPVILNIIPAMNSSLLSELQGKSSSNLS